jgi:two-component system LytT family response regulator
MTDLKMQVLIADDEEIARKRMRRLLAGIGDVDLVGECHDGAGVLEWVDRQEDLDVLLLDIRMPGIDGIETKALMPADGPYVIFTTAHQEHALDAFEVGAVDYLLKPIEAARLRRALDRARRHLGMNSDRKVAANAEGGSRSEPGVERIPVSTRQGIVLIDPKELTHAIFDGELVTLHTARGEVLCDYTLQDLELRLGGDPFVRVHRRALLNLERVARLEPLETGGFTAHTLAGERVPVSRQAARRLRKRFGLS